VIDFFTFHSQEFQMKKQLQQGFTLIELMIVVAIIGILAAIAIPAYQDYTIRAQATEGLSLADGAKTALAEYYTNKGTFPADNAAAGLAAPGSITGNYVADVGTGTDGAGVALPGVIDVTYGNQANAANLTGKHLQLSAIVAGGSVQWTCKSNDLKQKYLPSSCKGQ
jgi:type IV pilus assembly protein PilA